MRLSVVRLLLAATVIGGVAVVWYRRDLVDAQLLQAWVTGAGMAAPLVFLLLYVLGTIVFLPAAFISLAGGALFGPVLGAIYSLAGATLGAAAAFGIARKLAAAWVQRRAGGRLRQLLRGAEAEGWRFVAFVRLSPIFPFNVLNYALGLTRIRFSHYVVTSIVCMAPGCIAYSYLGYVGRVAMSGGAGLVQKGLLALALLATLAFLPRFIARLRQKPMLSVAELKQRLDAGEDLLLLDVRSAEEFTGELGHIAGARNIPLDQLPRRLEHLADYGERPVIVVCRTDRRSARAATLLAREGFADVHVAAGGMTAWNADGYPAVR